MAIEVAWRVRSPDSSRPASNETLEEEKSTAKDLTAHAKTLLQEAASEDDADEEGDEDEPEDEEEAESDEKSKKDEAEAASAMKKAKK